MRVLYFCHFNVELHIFAGLCLKLVPVHQTRLGLYHKACSLVSKLMDNQLLFQGPPGLAVPQLGGPAVATPTALSTPPQSLPAAVTAVTAPFAAAAGNPLQNPVTFNMVGPSGMPMTPNAAASLLTPLRPGTPGLGLPVMPPPINTTSAGECVCHISALQHHHVWECVCVMSLPFNTTSAGECVCHISALQHHQSW